MQQSNPGQQNHKTLEEALNYLNYIVTDENAFNGQEYRPQQVSDNNLQEPNNQKPIIVERKNTNKMTSFEVANKQMIKNRAICRVIETSKDILEKSWEYQLPNPKDEKKSYVTRFDIYLKQCNRLNERIHDLEKERQEKQRHLMEKEEAQLEEVYNYSVIQDFRQVVNVNFLKDRISRENIHMVMDSFKKCLGIIQRNSLKIFDGLNENSGCRTIKLAEIVNVDYHTQPHIFTILSVADKAHGSYFVYLRFESLDSQNKWDRALYCNYITRQLKIESNFFQIEYPEKLQQNEEENKKKNIRGGDHKLINNYEIEKPAMLRLIEEEKRLFEEDGLRLSHNSVLEQAHNINIMINKAEHTHPLSENLQDPSYVSQNVMGKSNNQIHPGNTKIKRRLSFFTLSEQNKDSEKCKSNDGSECIVSDRSKKQVSEENNREPTVRDIHSNHQSENSDQLTPALENSAEFRKIEGEQQSEQQFVRQNQREEEIKAKYQLGIQLTKSKFFINSLKIFYLFNEGFEYWDYDPKTKQKSQNKFIAFSNISSQKIDEKEESITFILSTNKTMKFIGKLSDIKEMLEWKTLHANPSVKSNKILSDKI